MENEHRPQSHKEREAQTLVDRIEKKEPPTKRLTKPTEKEETKRTSDAFRKTV